MKFLTRRGVMTGFAGLAAAALLAGCAGGSPDAGSSAGPGSSPTSGPAEMTTLNVAINPSTQFAPMYLGMETGIFERHHLKLNIVPQTDVAAIVSGVASGQYDFGFATVVHVLAANANGVPIRAVATIEGQVQTNDEGTVTIASKASGITDVAGLAGKKVAVVGLLSHNSLTLWALAAKAGIDPKSIQLVQLPFPQMAAALENGQVDAAVMQWPFAADALAAGGTSLVYNNREVFANTATTFFNTSQSYIDAHPDVVQGFSDAMVESIEAANADTDAARKALVDVGGMTAAQAKVARWNIGGVPYVNLAAFRTADELLTKYAPDKYAGGVDINSVVWPGALAYAGN